MEAEEEMYKKYMMSRWRETWGRRTIEIAEMGMYMNRRVKERDAERLLG